MRSLRASLIGINQNIMIKIIPIDVTSLKIAVTSTATKLFTLMDTAGSLAAEKNGNYYTRDKKANALLITPEDGDVRVLFGANPTATVGSLLKSGVMYYIPNVDLTDLRLIRTGSSNVNCSVEICISESTESPFAVAGAVTLVAGSVNIGEVQDAAATTTSSGTVAADTTAGGTQIVAANANRRLTQCQNNGAADVYFGTGTVTSSFLKVVPGGTFTWLSQEALKVLSSSGSCNIAYTDYINS